MKNIYPLLSLSASLIFGAQAFAANNVPAAITSVKIAEDATPGQVTLSWTEVNTDVSGATLPSGAVTYNVYSYDSDGKPTVTVAKNIKDTAYSFTALSGDGQKFVRYYVCAATDGGQGAGLESEMIPVGVAYKNFHATFPDGKGVYIWATGETAEGVMFGLLTDKAGFPSQDGDNGCMGISCGSSGVFATIRSGKISLAGLNSPVMSFYTYNLGSAFSHDENFVTVKARTTGGEFTTVYENVVWELAHDVSGWAKVLIDMSDFAGQDIEFAIGGTFISDGALLFDNISFPEAPERDLTLLSINGPDCVEAGKEFTVTAKVTNNGAQTIDNWTAVLKVDDKETVTVDGTKIAFGQVADVTFNYALSAICDDPVELTVEIECQGDVNTADNYTAESLTVSPVMSQLPYVKKISGSTTETEVKLSWAAPDLDAIPRVITEDFETGLPFSAEFGNWTFVDGDGSPTGGFNNVNVPNIEAGVTTGSFWIWDTSAKVAEAQGHSGKKFLFSMYRSDDGDADDWAISPELFPDAQTISFYAASWTQFYPDIVEVWYSKGSTDLKDFVKIEGVGGEVPEGATSNNDWTRYEASLPEGSKYFALRSCATGGFMLMIDDVSFRPQRANLGMTLEGYNIYRNGAKLNATPVADTSYTDANGTVGETYEYCVTTVFSGGESRGSKEYTALFGSTGVDSIEADTTDNDENAPIYDLTGRRVKSMVPGGFYIRNHKKIIGK